VYKPPSVRACSQTLCGDIRLRVAMDLHREGLAVSSERAERQELNANLFLFASIILGAHGVVAGAVADRFPVPSFDGSRFWCGRTFLSAH
jgi:hypothetical protein